MSVKKSDLKPYMSLSFVLLTLFSVVFIKMEVRRVGYVVLKESSQFKRLQDSYRIDVLRYAQFTRPDRVQRVALSESALTEAHRGQIIQMSGKKIALRQ